MVFGSSEEPDLYFNGIRIDVVSQYKYLGFMVSPTSRPNTDIFQTNYEYLCNQARRAVFAMQTRLKDVATPTPKLYLDLFNALVKQILTYGSDNWRT